MSVNEWIKSQLVPNLDDYGRPLPSRDRDRELRTMQAWPESVKHFERWQHYRKAIEAGFYNDWEECADAYSEQLALAKVLRAQTAHTHQGVVWDSLVRQWESWTYRCIDDECEGE